MNQNNSIYDFNWRSFEIDIQLVRLLYLQWLFYFKPIECDALDSCKKNEKLFVFDSPKGRSFSLSPVGIGKAYIGGGKGNKKLVDGNYKKNADLIDKTEKVKNSLDNEVEELRQKIKSLIKDKNYPLVWEFMQNFWWLRLGMHEFVYDVCFNSKPFQTNEKNPVRDFILNATYSKIDLSKDIPYKFTDEQIDHSLSYNFSWNRYGCCSYDCGPIAIGKEGFVPYKDAADKIKHYFLKNNNQLSQMEKIDQKRDFAADSLKEVYNFLVLYHQKPMGFYTFEDFEINRDKLLLKIEEVKTALNETNKKNSCIQ